MKKRTYLSAGLALLIGTLSVHASPGLSDIKSRVLPAVYKSKNGLTQKVEISVKHEGEPSTVTIRLGEQSRKTGSPLADEYGAAHAYGYRLYPFPNGNLGGTASIH